MKPEGQHAPLPRMPRRQELIRQERGPARPAAAAPPPARSPPPPWSALRSPAPQRTAAQTQLMALPGKLSDDRPASCPSRGRECRAGMRRKHQAQPRLQAAATALLLLRLCALPCCRRPPHLRQALHGSGGPRELLCQAAGLRLRPLQRLPRVAQLGLQARSRRARWLAPAPPGTSGAAGSRPLARLPAPPPAQAGGVDAGEGRWPAAAGPAHAAAPAARRSPAAALPSPASATRSPAGGGARRSGAWDGAGRGGAGRTRSSAGQACGRAVPAPRGALAFRTLHRTSSSISCRSSRLCCGAAMARPQAPLER